MDRHDATTDETVFLARAAASAMHEINNCLAILGEQGGLMEDLAFMMGQGRPVDPARLASVAAGVKKQVARAASITGNLQALSRFARGESEQTDVSAVVALCGALFSRFASRAKVELFVEPGSACQPPDGNPFDLCRLLFACLEQATAALPDGGELTLAATGECGWPLTVRIGGAPVPANLTEDPEFAALCRQAKLAASISPDGQTLELTRAD